MGDPLYTFLPTHSSDQMTFWGSFIIVLIAAAALFYLLRKKSAGDAYRRQMLLAMLVFFAMIMSAVTAFFSFWSLRKTGPVYVYEQSITTPYGNAEFKNINKAYIDLNKQQSLLNPGTSTKSVRMLFLEESHGKIHVLSEENYDIDQIFMRMKSLTTGKVEKE
ncbi:MAG: hypothetical protein KDC85_01840 [Saprospiraceae bacterium]|nr:hypothetical protein [Saprospiraceae bacterium]MCB9323035.1 hypothetical protein [Lewinellaceae bacterium]